MRKIIALCALITLPFQLMTEVTARGGCKCQAPEQGEQGIAGSDNFVDAFGSDYTLTVGPVVQDTPLPIELINANVNIIHTNNTFVITEAGHYFLFYGVSNESAELPVVAAFVNDVEVPGTRIIPTLFPPGLNNVTIIVALNTADVVDFRAINPFLNLSNETTPLPVQAPTVQANLIRLGPLELL